MTRVTTLRPLGIIDHPNDHGQYPDGALSEGQNAVLRRSGILEPMPAFTPYRAAAGAIGTIFRRLFPAETGLFGVAYNGVNYGIRHVTTGGSTAITFPEVSNLQMGTARSQMATHRGRYYFSTQNVGVLSVESEGATTGYVAGFLPPRNLTVQARTVNDSSQAVPENSVANWRALFARKGSDGSYIKIGPPSTPFTASTGVITLATDFTWRVSWPSQVNDGLREGDIVELYRTVTQSVGTDPGAVYLLTASHALTATDLANEYVDILDATPDSGLGAALYTNAGEQGESAAKFPPPYAIDLATHKGHMFYVAPLLAGYFQGRVPGAWGNLLSGADRLHGIGTREIAGTTTLGSTTLNMAIAPDYYMNGLAAGQTISDELNSIPADTEIVSVNVGAKTLVMSNPAFASNGGAGNIVATDRIEIDGLEVSAAHPSVVLASLAPTSPGVFVFDQAIEENPEDTMYGLGFRIVHPQSFGGIPTLRATNGQNYDPALPWSPDAALEGSQDARPNRIMWSELDQPEAVPPGNELIVGSGEIYRIMATLDALYVFCSDGLYRLSGFAPDWRVDPIDPTLILAARNALDTARQVIWASTNRGIVAITDGAGVQEVSTGILLAMDRVYADTWDRWLTCDESTSEVWSIDVGETGAIATVFNTLTKGFTRVVFEAMDLEGREVTASTYLAHLPGIVFATDSDPPDVVSFHATEKAEGVVIHHQPFHGDGDPFTSKNWVDCTWLMFVPTDPLALLPRMNDEDFPADVLVTVPPSFENQDARGVSGISLNAAFSASLAVGFTPEENATQAWQYKGISVRYRLATEQGPTR